MFWNDTTLIWEGSGCKPTNETTSKEIVCSCNHMTAFSSEFDIRPNPINFNVLTVKLHTLHKLS